jgi:hypothetical protein
MNTGRERNLELKRPSFILSRGALAEYARGQESEGKNNEPEMFAGFHVIILYLLYLTPAPLFY